MATCTKLPWDVTNGLDELMHELKHVENLNSMMHGAIEEIEEWRHKSDRETMALAYELERESLMTVMHLQMKLIREVTASVQELRQYDPSNDTDDAEGWENRSIPTIDIDAMDRARAQEQHGNGESGQQK